MIPWVYLAGVLLFVLAFKLIRLVDTCLRIVSTASVTVAVMRDPAIGDDAKEQATQSAAIAMMKQSVFVTSKSGVVLGVAVLPFWVADSVGVAPWNETMAFAMRLDVLGATTVAMMVIVAGWRRWRGRR